MFHNVAHESDKWKGQVVKFKAALDNYAAEQREEKTSLFRLNLSPAVNGFVKSKVAF